VRGSERSRLGPLDLLGGAHVRVGRVLAIVLGGALLQVLSQTILARTLPKDDVGLVSLLIGTLPLLSTLSLAGQDAAAVRHLSRVDAGRYDVPAFVRRTLALVVPLAVGVALAYGGYYALSGLALATAVVLVVSQNTVAVVTSVVRAAHRYELAIAGTRLPVIGAALLLALLLGLGRLSLPTALAALMAAYAGAALFLVARGGAGGSAGREPVPGAVTREGFFLLGLGLSYSLMISLDKLVIGKLLPYSDLAVYATIFAVMKGFDFLFHSINYVLMPRVNTMERVSLARLNAPIAALAAVVLASYLLLGDEIVHVLFDGRYDQGTYLILPFALSGVAKLFYSVPSSVIGGRLPRPALKQFLWLNTAGIVVNLILDLVLIRSHGLLGVAVATAIAWGLRLAGGYAVVSMNRSHLEAPREPLEV
jgi:O-antigen/teichoic acid export membrane protein